MAALTTFLKHAILLGMTHRTASKPLSTSILARDLTSGDIVELSRSVRSIAVSERDLTDFQNGGISACDLDESSSAIGDLTDAIVGEFFLIEDTASDVWWISEIVVEPADLT